MLAFTIPDTKSFMNLLLKQDTFDQFLFRQGEIVTFASFIMEGKRHMDFYAEEEQNTLSRYVRWEEMRPFVFQAVKLVFSLSEEKTEHLPNTAAAFLNILFRDNTLFCTTATAQENFSLDKSGEKLWEEYVLKFFKKNAISVKLQED